ncbi:inactive dipeptidyl peptidase 10 isoform X2 [Eurytemora carolleeae]|uniref:inactive dipeptidyl peptidase 10 isoform X2 n=1 Tax=Eurytemora carolleeae TaxID=1294199 RepID=UPI000C777068|nr:inactive dipeptidyl peptidase 10 isoform X2 [Eurytemora carolleeae]|eukprot:XP_023332862.1 inactive dipeptidyl peptidase 10-like isoform X2 [Eurytemora affinis]
MYSRISEDGSKLLYIGTIGGRSELILKDITTLGGQEIALTAGGLQQVRSLVGWEQKSGNIYYIGSRGRGDENLYRAELGAGGAISSSCLSCSSSSSSSSSSSLSVKSFRVSPNFKFYLQEEMVNVSSVLVSETRLVSLNTGEILSTLDLNHDLKHQISLLSLPRRRFIEFSKERIDLELTLPPTWRSNLEIQFPLFLILQDEMEGYSRPKNGLSWEDYLASEKEYIVGRVYHRKQQISRTKKIKSGNLKFSEVGDILKIIRHLIKNQSYISPSDICILGRSYGAWMVGAVLAEDSERFVSCAVLFNPISHWNKIDTWTSERYLGEIETGFLNYDSADISNYANRFSKRHVSVLVVDESTNRPGQVQQTFSLSKLLVDKGVMFKQMIYPDEKYPGENRPPLVSVLYCLDLS